MKDWIIPYLKKNGMTFHKEMFDMIERINFDCLESNTEHRGTFLGISRLFMEKLNCNFHRAKEREQKKDKLESENFTLIFGSVLADMEREVFEELSNKENIFIVFGTPEPAYIKGFRLAETSLPVSEEFLRVIIFEREVMSYPRLALRWIIAHELAHAIFEKQDDDEANEIALGWGFGKEKEEFDRYDWNKSKITKGVK